MTTKLSYTV